MSEQKIAYHLNFSDVIRILRLIDETPFRELQLEMEGLSLRVIQNNEAPAALAAAPQAVPPPVKSVHAASADPVGEQNVAAPAPANREDNAEGRAVLAPLAGTFYRAPSPGATPFVDVGSTVKEGDVVGILEIMKLMNHVTAPCAGVISRVCANNEEFVEFGQVLALIKTERNE